MKHIKLFEQYGKKDILTVLEENGGEMENKDLALACGYTIESPDDLFDFYSELKKLEETGKIKESTDKSKIILVK